MSKARAIGIAGCVIAVFAVLSMIILMRPVGALSEATTIGDGATDFQELATRFEDLARQKGAVYAFNVLAVAELPPKTDMHLLGHRIGAILYRQKGVDGIADCTQEFRNACSHSIVIGAFEEYGESALSRIHTACTKAPGGSFAYLMCYHGLGHGVIAYYDYDIPLMVKTCEKTGTNEYDRRETIACIGGAVMELTNSVGHDPEGWRIAREKYLDPKRPTALCTGALIPRDAQEICMVYLSARLFELAGINLGDPEPALFTKAFSYCAEISESDAKVQSACYGGIGKEFLPMTAARDVRSSVHYTDDQINTAIRWCGQASNRDGTKACIAKMAASAFWGGENDPSTALSVCRLAPNDSEESCYASLVDEILEYAKREDEHSLCSRIPSEFQGRCRRE